MIHERGILAIVMRGIEQESHIVTSALEQLKSVHQVKVVNFRREVSAGDRHWDGELTFKTNRGTFRYIFEVKNNLRPATVKHLLVQADLYRRYWGKTKGLLLLADYVNPSLGYQLKEAGINFIDTAGNL